MLSLIRKSRASGGKRTAGKWLSGTSKPPDFLKAPNGDRVPYPVGIKKPIRFPIHSVGVEALKVYLPDDARGAALINKAQYLYANVYRPQLMLLCRGSWVVCCSNGELIVTPTQQEAEELAYRHFQPWNSSVDCFVTCVGSEFTEVCEFGDLVVCQNGQEYDQDTGTGLYLPVEFSHDSGNTYWGVDMKHTSGATFVGGPAPVLAQFGLTRELLNNVRLVGADGKQTKCNVYKDMLFRLNGLVTKTDVVELDGPDWVLGQPISLRYKNVIDKTAPQVLTMEPLPGEMDHRR